MNNYLQELTWEDRSLFEEISEDIRTNPTKYEEAGKWLDEYCSEDSYWQRQENKLKELIAQGGRVLALSTELDKRHLEEEIATKRTPALLLRFQEARDYLFEKYQDQPFIPEYDAKRVVIITWILTDPDAENSNLNITEIEKWSWEPIDDVTKMSRGYANFLWFKGGKVYNPWMDLVRISWSKVSKSTEIKVSLPAEDERNNLFKSFVSNLLRASIKHLPVIGSFLYDVIYGTLDSQSSQKEKIPKTEKPRSGVPDSEKSSHNISLKVAKITLIAAIITLIGAILTSPLWRPIFEKWTGDSSETEKIPTEKKLPRSLKEVCKDIDSRPLLQRDETAKRYIGIKIKSERLKLFDIHEYADEGTFSLTMIFPEELDESYLTGRKFFCTVERDRYPELNIAERGLELCVSGQIKEAGRSYIKLSDVSLKFD